MSWRSLIRFSGVIFVFLKWYVNLPLCAICQIVKTSAFWYYDRSNFHSFPQSSRANSAAKRPSSAATNGGRQSVSSAQGVSSSEKPPSGKTKNIAQGLLSKEEEYM